LSGISIARLFYTCPTVWVSSDWRCVFCQQQPAKSIYFDSCQRGRQSWHC